MVEATKKEATYTLLEGRQLELSHHGDRIKVSKRKPVSRPIPPIAPDRPAPSQPPGREPLRRGVDGGGKT
jgi:alpha,alpha-trehalose phosphorylase